MSTFWFHGKVIENTLPAQSLDCRGVLGIVPFGGAESTTSAQPDELSDATVKRFIWCIKSVGADIDRS
jgi:hypothetical protein